jgi:hypothetical protein
VPRSLDEVHEELLASLTSDIRKDLSEHGLGVIEFGVAALRTRGRLEQRGLMVVESEGTWRTPDLVGVYGCTFGEAFLLGMRWQKERSRGH